MLPKNLKYGTKIESAVARSSRVNIQPQSGTTYGPNDTITINIPTRNNLVLVPTESYLKFDTVFTSGADANAFRFDSCGAHGLIQRIRVFHGSNLLQDIDNYGMLAKMLFDLQQSPDGVYGKQNILCGTRNDMVGTTVTGAAAASNTVGDVNTALATLYDKKMSVINVNSGERILAAAGTTALIANTGLTQKNTYCLNLISLVGSLCSNSYFPLFSCTSAPLRVEIQLVPNVINCCAALTGALANTFSITNCEYVANMIELGDSAMSTIYSSLGGEPLQFVFPDFKNFAFSQQVGTTATQVTFPIPAKYSSLKAILLSIRDKGTGAITFFPYSSVSLGISEYQFRVGATTMPAKPPNTLTECFAEVCKAIGSIGDIHYTPSIDKITYNVATSTANTESATAGIVSGVSSGSFYLGLDLENYAGASKDTLFSGYNSNTDDIYALITLVNSGGAVQTRFDAFANFDSVVVCENGTSYVKF
jgi:hypothetical protein